MLNVYTTRSQDSAVGIVTRLQTGFSSSHRGKAARA